MNLVASVTKQDIGEKGEVKTKTEKENTLKLDRWFSG